MPEPTGLAALAAQIERDRMRQALKGKLVHVEAFQGGKRITVPHIAIGGKLVRLTDAQIEELRGDHNG